MYVYLFSEDIPLMPVKWAIKAVLVNDMEMLKSAIENRQEVYTECANLYLELLL